MPQCKLYRCREEAVPGGKSYCPKHLAEYKARQALYAAAPACIVCHDERTRHETGVCPSCRRKEEEADEQARRQAEANAIRNRLYWDLKNCKDIDDLKTFLWDNIFNK